MKISCHLYNQTENAKNLFLLIGPLIIECYSHVPEKTFLFRTKYHLKNPLALSELHMRGWRMYKQIDNKKLTPRLNIPGKFCVEKKSKKKGLENQNVLKIKKHSHLYVLCPFSKEFYIYVALLHSCDV